MTQEDKKLLLQDLCARLPYNVMVDYESHVCVLNEIDPACKNINYITVRIQDVERSMCAKSVMIENIKPYLRPMSSMTDKELIEFLEIRGLNINSDELKTFRNGETAIVSTLPLYSRHIDWLNAHHFDYRSLIEKGLALVAPEGMYN